MKNLTYHKRWLIEVPKNAEKALCDWLFALGCTATYHGVDPSGSLYAYFPPGIELPDSDDISKFPGAHLSQSETFEDDDWLAKSREGFDPINIGSTLRISPIWSDCPNPTKRTSIIVNPGLAFGTGGHETTRLCMSMLEDMANTKMLVGPMLDIGTGTGILAFTAWLLGAKNITAFDYDQDCETAINDFLKLNDNLTMGAKPFNYFIGTIDDQTISGPYNTIVANIFLETIQAILPRIAQIANPKGFLLISGILAENKDEALISLMINNFKPIKITQDGNWIAILASCCCYEQS
jgi:ribosomal protein L11 methyltransferase